MVDIRRVEEQIRKVQAGGSARDQQSLVSSLVSAINSYVDAVEFERDLVQSIRQIEVDITSLEGNPNKARELKEMEGLLNDAKNAERTIGSKKSALRSLESELSDISRKIRRVT